MASILEEYGPRGVRVIALSTERKDTPEKVADWMKRAGGAGLETGAANAPAGEKLHALGGVKFEYIPSTVFVSATGAVKRVLGPEGRAEIAQAVEAILAAK